MTPFRGSCLMRVGLLLSLLHLGGADSLPAQALPFHTSTGLTTGFNENAARHFVGFAGREGLVRDGAEVTDPLRREIRGITVVNGAVLGAFTPLWTVRVIVPWVRREMEFRSTEGRRMSFESSGVGDASVQTKWIFFRDDRPGATTRVGLQGRIKVPLGETDARLPSGEVAPRPLQVGTGSWDLEPRLIFTNMERRLGVHANVAGRLTGRDDGFEGGDAFLYDLALGFRLLPEIYESIADRTLVAYLELNGELAGRDEIDGVEDPDSGGHLLFLSPGLQWIPTPWLLFEGSLQLPVLQALDGAQLEHDPRVQLGLRYRFSLFR